VIQNKSKFVVQPAEFPIKCTVSRQCRSRE
jgi:hypothetical protein